MKTLALFLPQNGLGKANAKGLAMLLYKVLVFCLGIGVLVAENEWLNVQRKEIWKALTESLVEVYFNCNQRSLFSYDVFTDILEFWNVKYELKHTEYGCAILCVALQLELVDPQMQFIIANVTRLLEVHGADEDVVKTALDLYEYCRSTIKENIRTVNVLPCWLALEFMRCYRDGIEDMNWIPDVTDLNPKILEKYVKNDKRRAFTINKIETATFLSGFIEATTGPPHLVKRETSNDDVQNVSQNITSRRLMINANKEVDKRHLEYGSITNTSTIRRFLGKVVHTNGTRRKKYNFLQWRRHRWFYPTTKRNMVAENNHGSGRRMKIPNC